MPAKKPDPSIYTLAAERLGVQPSECLVVEDSAIGLQVTPYPYSNKLGARAAGTLWQHVCCLSRNVSCHTSVVRKSDIIVGPGRDIRLEWPVCADPTLPVHTVP